MYVARKGKNRGCNEDVDQCISNITDLRGLDDKDIEGLTYNIMKYGSDQAPQGAVIRFPFNSIKKLKGARYWIELRIRTGQDWTSGTCLAGEVTNSLTRIQELKRIKDSLGESDPTRPDKLSSFKNWTAWFQKVGTYFDQIRGAADVPLPYVYREARTITPEALVRTYGTEEKRFHHTTVLVGGHYALDNKRVWQELKSLVIDGPG